MIKTIKLLKYGIFACLILFSLGAKMGNNMKERSRLIEQHKLVKGTASQGIALAEDAYFSTTNESIYRYDTNWTLVDSQSIHIIGVNHLGAIDYHDGYIWGGFLNHGVVNGKHDPKLDRSIIAKINPKDLTVIKTWDITSDVTWIDPVCFDGNYLWVGDLSDLGLHRYKFVDSELVRDRVFRYPKEMHFSQGIRVVGSKLYTIHTFGTMDGLFEFDIPDTLTDAVNQPTRVWEIQETKTHLEGFDFVPGHPNQIWHAQGKQVDCYELEGLPAAGK